MGPLTTYFRSGVSFDPQSLFFLVDNVGEGVDLFSLATFSLIKTFPESCASIHFPMQVAFSERGLTVVIDRGENILAIYDIQNGSLVEALEYTEGGIVQVIAVSTIIASLRHV